MNNIQLRMNFDRLKAERSTLNTTLDAVRRYFVPFRGEFFQDITSEHQINWHDQRQVYDTTGIEAADKLAANVQSALTNPSMKWFRFQFRKQELNSNHEAKKWLETCEDVTWQELQDSNFDVESSEFYMDAVTFGTAIISEEAESELEWKGIKFNATPLLDCFFEEDTDGSVLRFYQSFEWTPLQIVDKFGTAPDWVKERIDKAGLEKIQVIFAVYKEPSNDDADTSSVLSPEKRPYVYTYFLHKDSDQLGERGGYYEMPAFVARWRKVSGSKWGYSPAHIALPDALTLNQITEDTLEALGKVIDPAILTTARGLLSDLDLRRSGVTIVKDVKDVVPFESKARFDVGELKTDRLQSAIRSAFYVDQLELKESPAMTATEVNARADMVLKLMGPTSGRMQSDFLDPLLKRTFSILMRAKQFPDIPEVVLSNDAEMDIEYTGPMSRAQRQDQVMAVNNWAMGLAQLADLKPQVLDVPDWDALAREVGTLAGVPARLMRDQKEIEEERKQKEEQMQQQMQMEQAQAGGDAMQSIGKGMQSMGGENA